MDLNSNLDEEIALVNRFVQSLKNEEKRTKGRILVIEKNIRSKEEELELLRLRYEQRVLNTYMQGRLSQLEKVLSSILKPIVLMKRKARSILKGSSKKVESASTRMSLFLMSSLPL